MLQSYLARQPVFDPEQQVIGYELLYRSDHGGLSTVDGTDATRDVIINSYIEIGLDKLVGPHLAFINITRDFIVNHHRLPPPSSQLVLEILENVEADDEIVAGVKRLIVKGYNIALDDFDLGQSNRNLIQFAHFIKIDILQQGADQLAKMVAALRKFPVKLVAEKVETTAQFELCRELGFDYYQGYSLCHPRIVRAHRLSANKLQVMQLLAKLQKEDADAIDVTKIIQQDVVLSYKLLRYINSASLALKNRIDSVNHAVILLGGNNIRQWVSMIALSGLQETPGELIHSALLRGKMCELLLESSNQTPSGSAFIVGLFSMLDALIGAPLERLLPMLQLNHDINDALLHRKGPYGNALKCIIAYEQGDWNSVDRAEFGEQFTISCYLRAMEWCNESARQLLQAAA
jgi:EAL and modified HD-GYP domain-containing signal transduction protein